MVIGPGGQLIARIAREAGLDLMNAFMCEVRLKISATLKSWNGPSSDLSVWFCFVLFFSGCWVCPEILGNSPEQKVQSFNKDDYVPWTTREVSSLSHSSVCNCQIWDRACFLNSSCCCSVLGLLAPSLFIISTVFILNLILAAGYIMNKSALFQNGWKCVPVRIADEVQAELRHITGKFCL